jgi:hypothetical protein
MEKLVKDLQRGDKVELDTGTGTITSCRRSVIIEAAPKMGGAWEIEWRDDQNGETGRHIASGVATVKCA